MSGPRDYASGTEKALYALSRATCYFPGCGEPVIKFVENHPTNNAQIAHIRGARKGSARYDAAMSDAERAHFDNLILLCKPHHDLVDKLAPDKYPVDELRDWKRQISSDRVVAAVAAPPDDTALEQALRSVAKQFLAERELRLDLGLFAVAGGTHHVAIDTVAAWRSIANANPKVFPQPPALLLKIINVGLVPVSVTAVTFYLAMKLPDDQHADFTLLGRNDFPSLNPDLPRTLGSGEGTQWLTNVSTARMMLNAGAATDHSPSHLYFTVSLATGEKFTSPQIEVADLP